MINSFFTLLPFLSQLPAISVYIIYYITIFSYNFDFAFSVSVAQVINSKRKKKRRVGKKKEGRKEKTLSLGIFTEQFILQRRWGLTWGKAWELNVLSGFDSTFLLFPLGSCSDDENQSTVQHAFPECKLAEDVQGGRGGISVLSPGLVCLKR